MKPDGKRDNVRGLYALGGVTPSARCRAPGLARQVVLACCGQDGFSALMLAPADLRADKQIALAAVQMISEQPAGRVPNSAGKWLVKQLSCAHSRTIGWLGLGKISRALESALEEEGGGTLADLQLVAANARMHSDLQTLRKCTEAIEHHSGSRQ